MQASLQNRLIVLIGALATFGIGAYITLEMPIDVFPDLTAPTVSIMTEAHGMAPEEVEKLVTFPIETSVNGMVRLLLGCSALCCEANRPRLPSL